MYTKQSYLDINAAAHAIGHQTDGLYYSCAATCADVALQLTEVIWRRQLLSRPRCSSCMRSTLGSNTMYGRYSNNARL
jgi:hypothetical protein